MVINSYFTHGLFIYTIGQPPINKSLNFIRVSSSITSESPQKQWSPGWWLRGSFCLHSPWWSHVHIHRMKSPSIISNAIKKKYRNTFQFTTLKHIFANRKNEQKSLPLMNKKKLRKILLNKSFTYASREDFQRLTVARQETRIGEVTIYIKSQETQWDWRGKSITHSNVSVRRRNRAGKKGGVNRSVSLSPWTPRG